MRERHLPSPRNSKQLRHPAMEHRTAASMALHVPNLLQKPVDKFILAHECVPPAQERQEPLSSCACRGTTSCCCCCWRS